MRTLFISIVFCTGISFTMISRAGAQNILDTYVQTGLESNLVLQDKQISLRKALLGLKNARSLYLPEVRFQTTYSTAQGGRNIPLPIGDLLNGVYTTLNHLTGTSTFPSIENETINFLPQNYYDAKIRTTVPILSAQISRQVDVREKQAGIQGYQLDIYERELVKQIKESYFNYLSALEAVKAYNSALKLAREGERTQQKLLDRGTGLPAYVLRAQSEVAQAETQVSHARNQVENARLYFNALLNRDASAEIDTAYNAEAALQQALLQLDADPDPSRREELLALQETVDLNEDLVGLQRAQFIPTLNGFLDLGSQAENFAFNNQSRYYMLGLQLDIPIFSGNRNRNNVQQAKLDVASTQLQLRNTRNQLTMSAAVASNALRNSYSAYQAALRQQEAALSYRRLIERGYQAGVHSYIETVDARNQAVSAQIAVNVNKFNVLIAAAALEREVASFNFKSDEFH